MKSLGVYWNDYYTSATLPRIDVQLFNKDGDQRVGAGSSQTSLPSAKLHNVAARSAQVNGSAEYQNGSLEVATDEQHVSYKLQSVEVTGMTLSDEKEVLTCQQEFVGLRITNCYVRSMWQSERKASRLLIDNFCKV